MKSLPNLRRLLSLAGTVLVFVVVLGIALQSRTPDASVKADAGKDDTRRDWPLFGGSISRNLVNLVEKDMPTAWNVRKGQEKNVKWSEPWATRPTAAPSSPAAESTSAPTTASRATRPSRATRAS